MKCLLARSHVSALQRLQLHTAPLQSPVPPVTPHHWHLRAAWAVQRTDGVFIAGGHQVFGGGDPDALLDAHQLLLNLPVPGELVPAHLQGQQLGLDLCQHNQGVALEAVKGLSGMVPSMHPCYLAGS